MLKLKTVLVIVILISVISIFGNAVAEIPIYCEGELVDQFYACQTWVWNLYPGHQAAADSSYWFPALKRGGFTHIWCYDNIGHNTTGGPDAGSNLFDEGDSTLDQFLEAYDIKAFFRPNHTRDAEGYGFQSHTEDWRSESVNKADAELGSENDIGCYGGHYANGNIGLDELGPDGGDPDEQDFGWDPYCVIDSDCDELDGTLRNDYYKAFDFYEVLEGDALEIEPGTFIENDADVEFHVDGMLTVDGDIDGPVYFTKLGASDWDGIRFTSTADWESGLSFAHISYAEAGVRFLSVADGATEIIIDNCTIMNCSYVGYYISNTEVIIQGNADAPTNANQVDLEDFLALEDADRWNTVRQVRGAAGLSTGIYVSSVDNVTIDGTKVFLCGNENREDEFDQSGIWLFGSDINIDDVSILQNGNTGLYSVWSDPKLNDAEDEDKAVDLKDNGTTVNDTESGNGAEIYAKAGSNIEADYCDYYDVDAGAPQSYAIWVDGSSDVDADHCYWGVDEDDFTGNEGDFINTPARVVSTSPLDGVENDDDWIADLSLFAQAKLLKNSGEFRDAISLFERVISDDPTSSEAIRSVRYIFACYETACFDMDDLRDYYAGLAEYYAESFLCDDAELLIARTYLEERRFEDAKEEFDYLVENGNNATQRGLAEAQSLQLEMVIDGNQVDGVRMREIDDQVREILSNLGELDSSPDVIVPDEFNLTHAYPNPFNSTVTIGYALNDDMDVTLTVFDQTGRQVAILHQGQTKAGYHNVAWAAHDFPSGVYLCRLESANEYRTIKLALVK